jgi:uncharacterized membrane protein YgcG
MVTAFSVALQKIQLTQTKQKMELIQKTLYEYRLAFNRLPCPADATIAVSALNFGVEAANPGACTGGVPAANFSQTPVVGAQDVREGMVPTKTLQLPDDVAFDGWGRRFMYAVSRDMTQTAAFAIITTYDSNGRINIKNAQNTVKSNIICQALISFGPNGHGAYPRNGGAVRINASSINTAEHDNCDCNSSAAASGVDGVYVQKDLAINPANKLDSFDDIVEVSSRGDYILPSSVQAQPFGTNAGGGGMTGSGSTNGGGGTVGGGGGLGGGGICDGGTASCGITGGIRRCLCAL